MIVHQIHDLSNKQVIELLQSGLSQENTPELIKNYHPDYSHINSNLFYILGDANGRYRSGYGCYYVMESTTGEYIGSAGWNEYTTDTALVLSRMYVRKSDRSKYYCGQYILPQCIASTVDRYTNIWATFNSNNAALYHYYERKSRGKRGTLFNDWANIAKIYENFYPVGERVIYNTKQWVIGYKHDTTIHTQQSPEI